MYPTSSGFIWALLSASSMHLAAPTPSGEGAVTWYASEFAPYPTNSARITAPRRLACSSSSRITTPAPSPSTKPSRSRSNGRLARVGSSFRVESAFITAKPPIPRGVIAASAPPAITASVSPNLLGIITVWLVGSDHHSAFGHRHLGRGNRVLGEEIHPPDLSFFDELLGIEVFHFTGDACVQTFGREPGDRT